MSSVRIGLCSFRHVFDPGSSIAQPFFFDNIPFEFHFTLYSLSHTIEYRFGARTLLAQEKATEALELLAPLLINAQTTEHWDNVIEMLLLQAQAYQMSYEMQKALAVLTQAVSIAQPEGYIRRFVDEGPRMATLLSKLRGQERKQGPTPYLDSLLEAFFPEREVGQSAKTGEDLNVTVRSLVSHKLAPHSRDILATTRMSIPHLWAILSLEVEDIPPPLYDLPTIEQSRPQKSIDRDRQMH